MSSSKARPSVSRRRQVRWATPTRLAASVCVHPRAIRRSRNRLVSSSRISGGAIVIGQMWSVKSMKAKQMAEYGQSWRRLTVDGGARLGGRAGRARRGGFFWEGLFWDGGEPLCSPHKWLLRNQPIEHIEPAEIARRILRTKCGVCGCLCSDCPAYSPHGAQ